METNLLLAPASVIGLPAPFWFIELFKIIGFSLHLIPMSLWLCGIPLALILNMAQNQNAKKLSGQIMNQMPVLIALGVNFGIVPLLFLQVGYYKVFYNATILMAWHWLSIIPLLTIAYYGIYVYVVGLRAGNLKTFHKVAGWVASILFIAMSYVFSSAFALMTNVKAWPELWKKNVYMGATTGVGMNMNDPSLMPRWLMVFGLALMITATYGLVQCEFFSRAGQDDEYKRWVRKFTLGIYVLGAVWFAIFGKWYLGTWQKDVLEQMLEGPKQYLTIFTAISPALVFACMLLNLFKPYKLSVIAIAKLQILVVFLNAVSRQIVQNIELSQYMDLRIDPVNIQWSPMILFLVLFVLGLGLIFWMVRKALQPQSS